VSHEAFGIRHHGPGSARALLEALEAYAPDTVLVEGPADGDAVLPWAGATGTEPPVALLAYAVDQPGTAAFWPFAVFSPEWQAIRWAQARDVPVRFCDLPAAATLAARAGEGDQEALPEDEADAGVAAAVRQDPLARLAEAAGYDDAERWWDDVVESRVDETSPFPALTEAMAALRADLGAAPPGAARTEARREAYMRQTVRAALKAGASRVAVVCGAWHAPALTAPLPPASGDARILRGLAKRKVQLTWVPWTHARLAYASGYGAGITSPGWYAHLWTAPDRPVTRWLTRVAGALRGRDLPVSSAHVIEAVRLAEALAGLRGRPLAGLVEVTDATRAVLCDGREPSLRFVTDELVVGQAMGRVDEAVPTVPLEADLLAQCRTLRIRREAIARLHDLDLRKPFDRRRSVLFHRLRVLGLDWVVPTDSEVQSRGTFRETWTSEWKPEHALTVLEASGWGTTVETAATAKTFDLVTSGSLMELTQAVEQCLRAELPSALAALLRAVADRAALDADVVHLMEALPPLARARRYGDVRGTDAAALAEVAEVLAIRVCTGLPQALGRLDEDRAVLLRRHIDRVHAALGLLESAPLQEQWLATLDGCLDRPDVSGLIMGRIVRILADAERLDDVAVRLARALSHGASAAAKAAWVDGFFADGALLVVHDHALRDLLDGWVAGLDDEEFGDVLPLVRRTFGTFSAGERRLIAGRVANPDGVRPPADEEVDLDRAAPALATVRLILGAP